MYAKNIMFFNLNNLLNFSFYFGNCKYKKINNNKICFKYKI